MARPVARLQARQGPQVQQQARAHHRRGDSSGDEHHRCHCWGGEQKPVPRLFQILWLVTLSLLSFQLLWLVLLAMLVYLRCVQLKRQNQEVKKRTKRVIALTWQAAARSDGHCVLRWPSRLRTPGSTRPPETRWSSLVGPCPTALVCSASSISCPRTSSACLPSRAAASSARSQTISPIPAAWLRRTRWRVTPALHKHLRLFILPFLL